MTFHWVHALGAVSIVGLLLFLHWRRRNKYTDYETDLLQNRRRRQLGIDPQPPKPSWSEARIDGEPYEIREWATRHLGTEPDRERDLR